MKTPIVFRRSNENGTQITLTAVGDIMMQEETQLAAQNAIDESITDPKGQMSSGFRTIFEPVESDLTRGDLLIGNLETPIAANLLPQHTITSDNKYICESIEVPEGTIYDGLVYGETKYPIRKFRPGLPNFNTHPSLAYALKDIGFDIVSTANNHTMDRGHNGIDRTIESLRSAGLDFVGTNHSEDIQRKTTDESPAEGLYIRKNIQEIRIAFFSFTNFLNQEFLGFRDHSKQVNLLPRKNQPQRRESFLHVIRSIKEDPLVDLVVISMHWGIDYVGWIFPSQRKFAYEILNAGADILLGHHSHVLQPMEKYLTVDGRETFIIYSLGNFTTDMPGIRSQTSIILYLGITKNEAGTFLTGMQYMPVARHCVRNPKNGKKCIQTVAIDRFPHEEFHRHRKRAIRLLGPGNLNIPDTDFSYPLP